MTGSWDTCLSPAQVGFDDLGIVDDLTVGAFGDLLAEVDAGHPVIAFQNLGLGWLPRWHYAVVTGYDLDAREISMHSGELSRLTMDFALFERTWRRGDYWAITLLPPNDMTRDFVILAAARLGVPRLIDNLAFTID